MTSTTYPRVANLGIAVVAPSGYPPDDAAFARGIDALEQQGCVIHHYYDPATKYQRFGASDQARTAQLHAAASNPDVQVILAARGGYGLSRILPMLDLQMLAESKKLFVGHSDFTALHLALLNHGNAISFAGPMVCADFGREETSAFTMHHFWQCLTQANHAVNIETPDNPETDVTGTLWGGNLAMLTHLIGTPYFPQIDGGILFVEDINEHPYRVERMMLQLLHAGILARQKAILFGDFSNYRLSEYDNGYDFNAMLGYLRSCLAMPVLTGFPFGHISDKLTLPVGCQAHIRSSKNSFKLTMTAYPSL